jgi:hypothetical protein
MKIELADETIEQIVTATLNEHLKYAKDSVKKLKKKKNLKSFELEDLGYNTQLIDSIEIVKKYFGA